MEETNRFSTPDAPDAPGFGKGGAAFSAGLAPRVFNASRDEPNERDYTPASRQVAPLLGRLMPSERRALPSCVDLRPHCPPVKDQGALGACTAFSTTGLMEFHYAYTHRRLISLSPLFTYFVTRRLQLQRGDVGSSNRGALASLVLCGVAPEKYWPYAPERFEAEPPPLCYAVAQNYQCTVYYRLDAPGKSRADCLLDMKRSLAAKIPFVLGFACFSRPLAAAAKTGKIFLSAPQDSPQGGHSVLIVGYDDRLKIVNPDTGRSSCGAFLLKNSWGTGWGLDGYGWLPYDYYLEDLAYDFWSVLNSEWIDPAPFAKE